MQSIKRIYGTWFRGCLEWKKKPEMKLVFASSNAGKISEVRSILPAHIQLISAGEAGYNMEIEETGHSFRANAAIKAEALFEATGLASIGDDSGLEVEALDSAPGIYS